MPMKIMTDDNLTITDIESAVLSGILIEKQKGDPRGIKYIIHGNSFDETTSIGIVGRFKETGVFLIITVYAVVLEGEY